MNALDRCRAATSSERDSGRYAGLALWAGITALLALVAAAHVEGWL